jgi:hypothetical protein
MMRAAWGSAVLLGFLLLVGGCAQRPKSIINTPREHELQLNQFNFYQDDAKLIVDYHPKAGDQPLTDVEHKVYGGELYLFAKRTEGEAKPREIVIDTTKLKLKQPWTDHVYWQTLGWYDNAVARATYTGPLNQHVGRAKLEVAARPADQTVTREIPPLPESTFESFESRAATRRVAAASQPANPATAPAEIIDPLTPAPQLLPPSQ